MHCLRGPWRESVSKNNGVFNPYPCPRPSFILSSFSSCITEISSAPWGLDENVTQYDSPCSYLSYRPCFSSLKDTLRESPPLFRERGTSLFFSFFLPFHLSVRVNTFWRRIEIKSHFFLREFVLYKSCRKDIWKIGYFLFERKVFMNNDILGFSEMIR